MCSWNSVIRQAPPELPTELWNAQDRSKDKAKACVPTLREVFAAENEDTLMAMAVAPCSSDESNHSVELAGSSSHASPCQA
jgi:hypothetical protein